MHRDKVVKVAFLTAYDRSRASSRVRIYDYLPYLSRMGFGCKVLPFPKRLTAINKYSFLVRALWLAHWADVVVLQKMVLRESFVNVLRWTNPRLIFDFDDALWAPPDVYGDDPMVQARYRVRAARLDYILRHARKVVAGSEFLAAYARERAPNVEVIRSSVDPRQYPVKEHRNQVPLVLGWIGSPENLADLEPILPVLRRVTAKGAVVEVVSSMPPDIDGLPIRFRQWEVDKDVEFLRSFDIGLMPLKDTERSRGRCGFKAVQYMAVGLPVVASNVGSAPEVVIHGKTGFLASSEEEWQEYLVSLMSDDVLRTSLGKEGRKRVECYFNLEVNAEKWADILREVAEA